MLYKKLLLVIGLLLLISITGFMIWGETPARPMPEALAALEPDSQVTAQAGKWLIFSPAASQPASGLIFYPGGRVDYRAYAPAARQVAANGYLVVIVRMPLNLAILDAESAEDVLAAYPDIQRWAVGGHSLGGAMAAHFVKRHPDKVDGLVLWAAYPASGDDLSASGLPVVSIYGSLDGLATGKKIDASRALLPQATTWVSIQGGNHAQFGWYGAQPGDNPAAISRQDQQSKVVRATVALLESLR
ncbi:MAG: alpha/beta fold hydrolase [Omnitrophica WOR_2 bacterium]